MNCWLCVLFVVLLLCMVVICGLVCSVLVMCCDSVVCVLVLLLLIVMRIRCDMMLLCNWLMSMCCLVFGVFGRNVDRLVVNCVCLIVMLYVMSVSSYMSIVCCCYVGG